MTLSDAAKYLEGAFTETVSEADILQLALDGQLKLSVNFVNPVEVLLGTLTPKTEIPYETVLGKNGQHFRRYISMQHQAEDGEIYLFDKNDPIYTLRGVCDLTLDDRSRLKIERRYHSAVGGPLLADIEEDGAMLQVEDQQLCSFEMQFEEPNDLENFGGLETPEFLIKAMAESGLKSDELLDFFQKRLRLMRRTSKYCYLKHIPDDCSYVIRQNSLTDFINLVNGSLNNENKPLSTTERNTLLKLVIGMAVKGYRYDPAASKNAATKEIADDLAGLGITITDDTVRKYLKQAADAVLPAKPRQS